MNLRYVLVDRYTLLEPGRRARAVRAVTRGEAPTDDPLQGAFPPTLVLEAMAQTAGMLCSATSGWSRKMVLAKVESASFEAPVRPGTRLDLAAELVEEREGTYLVETTAEADGARVAEARLFLRGLEIESDEGRAFDTPEFRAARLENLRILGVTDLVAPPPA